MADAKAWSSGNAKLGAYLAAYLTVLIAGVLEDCMEQLVVKRVGRTGDAEVGAFVQKSLKERFRNPNSDRISELLGSFSTQYRDAFKTRVPSKQKESLNSIIANKNSLAHEGSWKLHVTLDDVDGYYRDVIPVLEAVEQVLS
ncbi:MAG: hypothetical protein HY683_06375 [Chloroflexi bacterium]|nr:hypothetical protein [Chloroflexota bacterium]